MPYKPDDYYIDFLKKTKFLKEATKVRYLKTLATIQSRFWEDNDSVQIGYILKHSEEFEKALNEFAEKGRNQQGKSLGDHTKDMYCNAIIALFIYNQELREGKKELYEEWKKLHDKIREPINTKYKLNEPTERQREGFVSYEDIIKVRETLEKGSMLRLLVYMYTEIPAVRVDFDHAKILEKLPNEPPTGENYIILDPARPMVVLESYKTAKKYGRIEIDMPMTLVSEIKASLDEFPRSYLFVSSKNGMPYETKDAYRLWANKQLKKLFNKNFSLTTFRHAYISRRDLQLEKQSGIEKEKVSKLMGHGIEQQRKYSYHTWLNKKEKNEKNEKKEE